MRTADHITPSPLLELARDGWEVNGPFAHQWNPGRRYHAANPDSRVRLRAANFAQHGPYIYDLVTTTSTEHWSLTALNPAPAAIYAAARAAVSCGQRAPIEDVLIAAGWRATPVYGTCGALTEATYTAPDQVTVARLVTNGHAGEPDDGYWMITHVYGREPSTANATIPAPVLAAFLLALAES